MLPPLTGKTLGQRIQEARNNAGLGVKEQFRREIGGSIATSTISDWEADRNEPKVENLKAIRRVTRYSIDELVGPDEPTQVRESAQPVAAGVAAPPDLPELHPAVGAVLLGGRVGKLSDEDALDLDREARELAALHGGAELVAELEDRLPRLRRQREGLQERTASPGQAAARKKAGDDTAERLEANRKRKGLRRLPSKPAKSSSRPRR